MTLKQQQLMKRIKEILRIKDSNPKATLVVKLLLNKNSNGKDRNKDGFYYRLAIGSLPYLAGYTRPDISMAVHQVAKFLNNPKACHDIAIKRIGKYILGTLNKSLIYRLNIQKGLEVFTDANFAGCFYKLNAENLASAYSQTGYIIKYAGCLII